MPWHKAELRGDGRELVICLHGLWRSKWAMEPIARQCIKSGFSCLNVPYPSFKESLGEMVERLDGIVRKEGAGYEKVHLVTHSLGGVIARRYLETCEHSRCEKVLMIAPPLHGSKIIDWLSGSPLRKVLGPAGEFLSTESMAHESGVIAHDVNAAVIMGDRVKIPLLHHVIDEESDGIVRVDAGRVGGLSDFKVVHADHTFITSHPDVLESVDCFLRRGKL
ncbi:esterase/lipase family protein [Rubritalea tangerina]|uniref:Esterase/lipase family protein n=2 Tax=Rubritalea tangerina TaxID=430798 RepID=A0ABW4ZBG8_9BACT